MRRTVAWAATIMGAVIFALAAAMLFAGVGTAATTDVGYRDFSFAATGVGAPTGEKPQSKLWFNDGTWWGSLFNRSAEEYHIYRYDWATHTWSDTGTLIDERNDSKADTLWDGQHLYVASAGPKSTDTSTGGRIMRYSYDAVTKSYSLDPGFPVAITSTGVEAIVLDKDTTGKLWVTYTRGKKVWVNHSLESDSSWGEPFVPPVNGTSVGGDDISAVVAFDLKTAAPQIGVMWSNQLDDAMYFASHKDGDPDSVWEQTRAAVQGPKNADDHINLKSLQADDASGRIFAAIKTSLDSVTNPNPNSPQIFLSVLGQDGNFTNHVFGRVGDKHTRPLVLIDEEHRDLYVFATAPVGGGTIYYKKTPLSDISFPEGRGTPFIQSSTDPEIDDATSTKQNLSSSTGLVVLAADSDSTDYYLHNTIDLSGADATAPTISIATPPDGATYSLNQVVNADYACADEIGGSGLASCDGPVADGEPIDTSSTGPHSFTVTATDNTGNSSSLTHTYTVEDLSSTSCTITGTSSGETLKGTSGNDVICGLGGNDIIKGLGGDDILKGDDGNDRLLGGTGNDTLDGGLGTDTANYGGSKTAIVASLEFNSATGEGSDTLASIESLIGSKLNDDLSGSGGANTLTGGGGGDDAVRGGGGNDKVVGNGGADSLFGEDGADTLNSKDGVNGNDSLDGGPGTDKAVTDATEASIVGIL